MLFVLRTSVWSSSKHRESIGLLVYGVAHILLLNVRQLCFLPKRLDFIDEYLRLSDNIHRQCLMSEIKFVSS